jgi:hypothetical protein
MIRSTPHPPEAAPPQDSVFDINLGNLSLFTVKPDVKAIDALVLASECLECAAATAYETADNSSMEFRPLARSVVHQIKAVQALVKAAAEQLEGDVG